MSGTDDRLREAMLRALVSFGVDLAQETTDALLPVVRAYGDLRAAEELRAAAQEQRNEAANVPDTDEGTHADGHRCAAEFIDRRAAALTAREEAGR